MSFCVGTDDSLPENILYKGLKLSCGRLSSRPYIQLRNSYCCFIIGAMGTGIGAVKEKVCPNRCHLIPICRSSRTKISDNDNDFVGTLIVL